MRNRWENVSPTESGALCAGSQSVGVPVRLSASLLQVAKIDKVAQALHGAELRQWLLAVVSLEAERVLSCLRWDESRRREDETRCDLDYQLVARFVRGCSEMPNKWPLQQQSVSPNMSSDQFGALPRP
jgi:hypothetical protein